MKKRIRFLTVSCLCLLLSISTFAQENVTIAQENGTMISIGPENVVEMATSDEGIETYILTPVNVSGLAGITILEPDSNERGSAERKTVATGKKITIWLPPSDEEGQADLEFLIEGEARVIQGADRMYGPKSIEFKDRRLTILSAGEKEGELLYTFTDGRRVDWRGHEFHMTFKVDENGDYVLNGFTAPQPTRFNFFHPGLRGGIGHLIPLGRSTEKESTGPGRKVSPSE